MKKGLFFLVVLMAMMSGKVDAQMVADTFNILPNGLNSVNPDGQISNYHPRIRTWTKYTPFELAAKGIVPGVTIFGIAYFKPQSGYLPATWNATLNLNFRCGDPDSTIPTSVINGGPTFFLNNYVSSSFASSMSFSNGSNMTIPATISWLPFMLDGTFVYTGGSLEIFTDWQMPVITWSFGNFGVGCYGANPYPCFYYTTYPTNMNSVTGMVKTSTIIYHSTIATPCSGMPVPGNVSGNNVVCINKKFKLYLNNPSAGPGISYQWQKSALTPLSWTNISGATIPVLSDSITNATQYRCIVSCNNSGLSAISNNYTVNPHYFSIDSVNYIVNGNLAIFTPFYNDTISSGIHSEWYTGDGNITNSLQYQYNNDGDYNVSLLAFSGCNNDTFSIPVHIGCNGSATFNNTISSSIDSVCPGNPVSFQINDTLPNNYTVEWYYKPLSGAPTLISGYSGSNAIGLPTTASYFYNKSICNISGNYKTSNHDTIYMLPSPTAGTITALNTTTNYYNFTNTGMSNAQSYKWYFGDGDSSTSLAPIHHYNLASTYNVWFVVTNAGNGCTDTAFTTVTITTGMEDVQGRLFSVSPNPFKESFVVNCPSEKGTITVTDAVGKVVASYQLPVARGSQSTTDHSPLKIDMKGFSNGVYLVKYQNESQTETVKIIKE